MDTYTTINDMQEISWNTGYLLGKIHVEITGTGYCVDDMQMMQTVKSQLMTSRGSHIKQSHKSITQNDHTNQLHKSIPQEKMMSRPRMEMSNDAFRCSRATQVHMEDLRLVNLTEFYPSRRMNEARLLVNALNG